MINRTQVNSNAVDFVEEFKLSLYAKEIYVFTPQGELKSLPKGATPLDFAFQVHTQVGLKTRGARVNGKLVPLGSKLQSGDRVEIITSENARPSQSWLNYVATSRARAKIKLALKDAKRTIAKEGKEILRRKLKSQKIILNEDSVNKLVTFFKLKTSLDLFYRVGIGVIDNERIKSFASSYHNIFLNFFKNRIRKPGVPENVHKEEITTKYDMLVFGKEETKLSYRLAPCCKPIPGDRVFGFLSVNDGIKVHKKSCPNAIALQSNYAYRIMQAKWIDSSQEEFSADIQLTGIDTIGLVNRVTKVISENLHVNMRSISFSTEGGTFTGKITLALKNNTVLKKIMHLLKQVEGIEKVTRIDF